MLALQVLIIQLNAIGEFKLLLLGVERGISMELIDT